MTTVLPDGSAFFVAEVPVEPNLSDPIAWNPWNKVVQDHRDGTVLEAETNVERAQRGLPTPWTPDMAETECREPPVW
jgi:hypothetical protein